MNAVGFDNGFCECTDIAGLAGAGKLNSGGGVLQDPYSLAFIAVGLVDEFVEEQIVACIALAMR